MKYTVDIDAGNAFVERLKIKAPSIGGFGGAFKIPTGYEKPLLVSGTDGVGTKMELGGYSTIGIDLVAMCVNDIITCGAKPLYFLDYISTKKIDDNVADIMVGILKGCEIAGIELIGGETAEHYKQSDYDLAGFCTGIVEEDGIIDGRLIKEGDVAIGIESSGIHCNGYTLINECGFKHPELLTPTTIYTSLVSHLLHDIPVLGMAHITGGGLVENLPRCLPKGLKVEVNYNSWRIPEIFQKIMLNCEVPEEEMCRTFNMGIGYVIIVPPEVAEDAAYIITKQGYKHYMLGNVTRN